MTAYTLLCLAGIFSPFWVAAIMWMVSAWRGRRERVRR